MSFANFWPLFFAVLIPAIVILYILKPKGKDVVISSNLLWKRIFKNMQSRTFFERFKNEILMYIQLLTVVLLIIALMAPFVMARGGGGDLCIVIDTSLSMQHKGEDGKMRLDNAKDEALKLISGASGNVTLISFSDDTRILANASSDHNLLKKTVKAVDPEDTEGDVSALYSLLMQMESGRIVFLSDGGGVKNFSGFADALKADAFDCGEPVNNLSIDYVYCGEKDGKDQVSVRVSGLSDKGSSFELSLYDKDGKLLGIKQGNTAADGSTSFLFDGIEKNSPYYRAELQNINFEGGSKKDSLAKDDTAYCLSKRDNEVSGILIGNGNTFIEKAFFAGTGSDLTRSVSDAVIPGEDVTLAIYDAGFKRSVQEVNSLEFLADGGEGELDHVKVTVKASKLTEGLKEFTTGANKVRYYKCPDWAESFMEIQGKCAGYYGIDNGVKRIVCGFDLRESDFPVKAEFPVFMAEAVNYLSDLGMLAKNSYTAGESIKLNPVPEYVDISGIPGGSLDEAGIYSLSAGNRVEYYSVSVPVYGRDGRLKSEDIDNSGLSRGGISRRSLRNIFVTAVLILLILEWVLFAWQKNYRRRFYLVSRAVLVLLCILSLLGIRLPKMSKDAVTVFLADISESDRQNTEQIEEYLDKELSLMPSGNSYGIVCFGKDAQVDQFVTGKDVFMGLNTAADYTATDFEKAIQRAVSMIPDGAPGRIVVLTDGRQTAGDIENAAALVNNGNISLEAVKLPARTGDDCYMESVDLPEILHPGEPYNLQALVESNYETDAVISVISDGKVLKEESVKLKKGHNGFIFEETAGADPLECFEVRVTATSDTCPENDVISAYAQVTDAPKILVIRGSSETSGAFDKLLSATSADVDTVKASKAPSDLNSLLAYRTVILENAYKEELPEGFLENIDTYVKDYGRGFIMTGGEDSFMLGGYNESSIEKILPVNMELRSVIEVPETAIVLVIDHSGSMDTYGGNGHSILEVAVEAAKRSVDNLRDEDEVGVIAFDDRPSWYHELSDASDKAGIKSDIGRIGSGGGTMIAPAIEEAVKALEKSDAQIKHVILLTDGMGETSDFSNLTSRIKKDGITLSTVAVGQGSDIKLLKSLAYECDGRYYYADAASSIPRIFAMEVFPGGNSYLKNGDYSLSVKSDDITDGLFENGWPAIRGYVAGSAKTGASELIKSEEGDPILTVWQYGLGKTVAWNTDVSGRWSAGFSGQDDYAALWKRINDFCTGAGNIGEDRVDVKEEGGRTILEYHTDEYDDTTAIDGIYTTPEGETGELVFTAEEPGVYRSVIENAEEGLYNINVRRSDDGNLSGAFTTAAAVRYSDEYRFDVTSDAFDSFVDKYGIWLEKDENIWKKLKTSAKSGFELTEILLSLLLLLYFADVAGRRFGIDPEFKKTGKQAGAKTKAGTPVITEDIPVAEMQMQAGQIQAHQEALPKSENKKELKKKKAQPQPEAQGLDTGALLKKKRERDGGV
ncbi:MAG: VWA domain-containing protein [Lachnospiraceae bacterium]|nr:VWA domain-containing protein [Lachnospiraceae bacterium]